MTKFPVLPLAPSSTLQCARHQSWLMGLTEVAYGSNSTKLTVSMVRLLSTKIDFFITVV